MKICKSVLTVALLTGTWLLAVGCQDYEIIGPGDWKPAEQPDQLGETYLEDEFIQRTAEASDILFVVDNSCSMAEEQAALQQNFWNFIQFFVDSGLDYHIGITTLDDFSGGFGFPAQWPVGQLFGSTRYIDNNTVDPVTAFTNNMTMGDQGYGACEVGLEATFRAVSPSPDGYSDQYNAGFYRDAALLSVVIVSDEADGTTSPMECTDWASYMGYQEFIPWITNLKGSHSIDMIQFAAIVGDSPSGCSSPWGDAERGAGYLEVVDGLGEDHATFFSICDQDWSDVMTQLGLEAAGLRTSFYLSLVPVEGTLEAYLDPDGADGPDEEIQIFEDPSYSQQYSFVYNRVSNSLDFTTDTMPPEGAKLRVVYQIAEDA